MAQAECAAAPPSAQKICESLAGEALGKYLKQVYKESGKKWCKQ